MTMTNARKRITSLIVALGLLGAASVVVLHADSSTHAATGSAATIDADQLSNFAVLRKSDNLAGPLPGALGRMVRSAGTHFALLPDQARAITAADGTLAWVIPGSGALCVAAEDADGYGLSCDATKAAIGGRLSVIQRSTNGGESAVVGLVADPVDRVVATNDSGATKALAPTSNVYASRAVGLGHVTLVGGDGGPVTIDVP